MSVNVHLIAADLARQVPEMALSSLTNNTDTIEAAIKPLWDAYVTADLELKRMRGNWVEAELPCDHRRMTLEMNYATQTSPNR